VAREVAVHELQGVAGVERQAPGAELVQGDAERVEVGAVVHWPVHAPGLLRGHVGQGSDQRSRAPGHRGIAAAAQAGAEIRELERAGVWVEQDVGGIDVAVDDAAVVDLAQDVAQARRDVEHALEPKARIEALLPAQPGQGRGAEVLEHEHGQALHHLQPEHLDHTRDAQALQHLELVAIARHGARCGGLALEHLEDHGATVTLALGAVHDRGRTLLDRTAQPVAAGI
jgi:hypothetical protein